MDKKALRAEIAKKKRALTPEQIAGCSVRLAERLYAHPAYQKAKSIYGYLPYNQEVRTTPMLERAQRDGKRVAVDETALILMPGLAFDPAGRRCGYGGGFYDKWLAEHPGHPLLALCYGFQMLERLDTDPHDVPVDFVISEDI